MERLKFAAPPIPHKSEIAVQVIVRGNATFVAAFPNIPTLLPIKNWSTILYKELTSIAMILGIANLASRVPMGSVPSGFFCCSSMTFLLLFFSGVLPMCLEKPPVLFSDKIIIGSKNTPVKIPKKYLRQGSEQV